MKSCIKKYVSRGFWNLLKRIREGLIKLVYSRNLVQLGKLYGTDKIDGHFYLYHYQKHLSQYRNKRFHLLEIGIGGYENPLKGGESLRMWASYFKKAKIVGIDLYDKSAQDTSRIRTYRGSQDDQSLLELVVSENGSPLVVIDDGSHINYHVIKTFEILFPKLQMGGVYIIEDIQTSYWSDYHKISGIPESSVTAMDYFKSITDSLNFMERKDSNYISSYFDRNIISVHFYHNLIIINKGQNIEPSNILKID